VIGWLVGHYVLLQVVYATVLHEDFCCDFAGWVEAFRRLLDNGEEALMVTRPRGWAQDLAFERDCSEGLEDCGR
jgi:hypothetical protein